MTMGFRPLTEEAAVLLVLAGRGDEERILLTQRAAHLTLHGGEVAFPGGKREAMDSDLCCTAIRETYEEVGLDPSLLEIVGQLPANYTRAGIRVTPFVGRVPDDVELLANPAELESLFWVPTAFLLEDKRLRTDIFEGLDESLDGQHWAPVYHYLGYTIWGFTARVLVEFLNTFWDANIGREHEAPDVIYTRR